MNPFICHFLVGITGLFALVPEQKANKNNCKNDTICLFSDSIRLAGLTKLLVMPPVSLFNEHELLRQLQAGSEEAFTHIFDHYRTRIYSVALKFLRSPVLAEEIVQDVFLKLWLKRTELPEIKHLDNFLFIMARNFIFDRIKKMGYEASAQTALANGPSSVDDTEYLVRRHQCQQLLQEAIQLLPPQQKQAYQYAKVEGLSHQAIAQKMGISRLTVKTHIAKALQFIRKYLNTRLHYFIPFFLLSGRW